MLVDVHAHLNDNAIVDTPMVLDACRKAGVAFIVNASWDAASACRAAELSDKYNGLFFTVGIHPHNAAEAKDGDLELLTKLSAHPKCVGWGEIGLDYHYDFSPRGIQREMFIRQLHLAHKLHLPVIFHLRECYGDANEIISQNCNLLADGLLLHCYSGSAELVQQVYNRFNCYYSFGGAVTFKNAHKGEVLQAVPANRLLLETDCPYMAPVPLRGTVNTPANLGLICNRVAQELGLSTEELENITTENFFRFYRLNKEELKSI